MQTQDVFIVGWMSKTWVEIFGVFTDLAKAEEYQSYVRRTYAPCGSDMDWSYIAQRKLIIQGTLESLLSAEEIASLLPQCPSHLKLVIAAEAESESTLPSQ